MKKLLPGFLAVALLTGCGEREKVDGEDLVLKAIEEYRAFNQKVNEGKDAEIDLSYLEEKFPGMEICSYAGYTIGGPFGDEVDKREAIHLNEPRSIFEDDHKWIILMDDKLAFIYIHHHDFKFNVPEKDHGETTGCTLVNRYAIRTKSGKLYGNSKNYYLRGW